MSVGLRLPRSSAVPSSSCAEGQGRSICSRISHGIASLFQSEKQVFPLASQHARQQTLSRDLGDVWRGVSSHMKAAENVLPAPLRAVLLRRQGSHQHPSLRAFTLQGAAKSPKKENIQRR